MGGEGEEAPEEESEEDGGDLPPWLSGGGEEEEDSGPPPPPERERAARRNGNRRGSTQKKRRKEGTPMSLAQRSRTASAQRPRNHYYADNSGHFDGGPYGEDNQGENEGSGNLLADTPPAESVAAPRRGDDPISNTEKSLVARIQHRNAEQRRDLIAYEQITGRRLQGGPDQYGGGGVARDLYDEGQTPSAGGGGVARDLYQGPGTAAGGMDKLPGAAGGVGGGGGAAGYGGLTGAPGTTGAGKLPGAMGGQGGGGLEEGNLPSGFGPPPGSPTGTDLYQQKGGSYRYADEGEWPHPSAQSVSGTEVPEEVNPPLSGTNDQGLKGDFDSVALDAPETQPKDASVHAFRAFDHWLHQTTGRTARQHGNSNFIRRSAARFCSAKGWDPAVMFPALGNVLREARRNEGTNRRADNMRRYADESLDVAAPQDRIDVEAPVKDTTDADAQASQFDLGDSAPMPVTTWPTPTCPWTPRSGLPARARRPARRVPIARRMGSRRFVMPRPISARAWPPTLPRRSGRSRAGPDHASRHHPRSHLRAGRRQRPPPSQRSRTARSSSAPS